MPSETVPSQSPVAGEVRPTPPPERGGAAGVVAAIILVAMAGVLVLNIVSRSLPQGFPFAGGIAWSSQAAQHLTLWITFAGGILAAVSARHLSLGLVDAFLGEGKLTTAIKAYTAFVTVAVVSVLAYASARMVQVDYPGADVPLERLLPWLSEIVIPVGFAGMALGHVWRASDRWPLRVVAALGVLVGVFFFFAFPWERDVETTLLSEEALSMLRWPCFGAVIAAVLLGAPIYVGIGGAALVLFAVGELWSPVAIVPTSTFELVTKSELPMIPMLTFAGYLLAESRASQRLLAVFRAFFGWMPGGLAIVTACVCAFFTTFTGGSGITILALGGLVLPALVADGYTKAFSVGLVTAGGSLGLTFPPSFPLILYAIVAQNALAQIPEAQSFLNPSIENLFIAGALPGFFLLAIVCGYGAWTGVRQKIARPRFDLAEARRALWDAKWEVILPLVILVGFFSGWTTMVEAAAVTVFYVYVIEVFVYRDLSPVRDVLGVARQSAVLVGGVLAILGVAFGLSAYFVDAEIPQHALAFIKNHIDSRIVFLMILNVFLLIVGCLMDIFSAILVVVPIITPIGLAYGIDPVHMGIVFVINLELGYLTPPVGMNLFLASYRFEEPLTRVYRDVIPFLVLRLAGVLMVTYLESLTLGFLHLVGPQG